MTPLAEKSRRFNPYTDPLNNPIYFIDPDGMKAARAKEWIKDGGNIESTETDGMQTDDIILTFQNDAAKTAYENTVNKALTAEDTVNENRRVADGNLFIEKNNKLTRQTITPNLSSGRNTVTKETSR